MSSDVESVEATTIRRFVEARGSVDTPTRVPPWQRRFARLVVASDVLIIVLVGGVAVGVGVMRHWGVEHGVRLALIGAVLLLAALATCRAWERVILGNGPEEFNRVLKAVLTACVVLSLAGMALKIDAVRPLVFGVLPVTGLACLLSRYGLRRFLHRARKRRQYMSSVLVAGTPGAVVDLIDRTRRVPHQGWEVSVACTAGGAGEVEDDTGVGGVPVAGDLSDVAVVAREWDVDIVAITATSSWTPRALRRLSWQLEGGGVDLVVDPGLMEIGGPRLHVTPVDGLPLLRLTAPRFTGPSRLAKNAVDRLLAAVLLLLLFPVFLVVAALVARDGGPVFFRQTRIGLAGKPFRMLKFRSMVPRAEELKLDLAGVDEGAGPLFKLRDDPRVTSVGARLRRYSLDELPQLLNVLGGTMSLVGPRPPLPSEVSTYAEESLRKLLVRPGITGMWQVSGRSELSWEESVRLDLRYVENWSPALDLQILWKTGAAVVRGRGAY